MSTRSKALACFRTLMRAREQVFQNDTLRLHGSREKIRNSFVENRNVEKEQEILELIQTGQEAAVFLKRQVVQGELHKKDGNDVYSMYEF